MLKSARMAKPLEAAARSLGRNTGSLQSSCSLWRLPQLPFEWLRGLPLSVLRGAIKFELQRCLSKPSATSELFPVDFLAFCFGSGDCMVRASCVYVSSPSRLESLFAYLVFMAALESSMVS